jgi:outer membrane protein assembly factor BamE
MHPTLPPTRRAALGILLAAALLAGCANPLRPYRMEIQQGNYVTQEMASQLKLGMTKEQVRFTLGTPLINDIFHADRWDYVYTRVKSRSRERDERRLTVIFDRNDRLTRLEGDVITLSEITPGKE